MLSVIVIVTSILLLLLLLQRIVKSEWLDPMFVSALYWGGLIVFSVFFSKVFHFELYLPGLIPLFLLLVSFIIGSLVAKKLIFASGQKSAHSMVPPKIDCLQHKRIKWLTIIFSSLGMAAIVLQLRFLDIHIGSFADLLYAANTISVIRYTGGTDMPKYGLILMAFLYSAGFLGGIYALSGKGFWNKMISLLPFAVMLVFTITNSVKSGFIFMLILWVSGYIAVYVFMKNGQLKRIGRLVSSVVLIFVFILALIPLTQILRSGKVSADTEYVNAGGLSYFCSVNTFTIWYKSYSHENITGFKYTLSGINNFFFGEREIGLYGEKNVEVGKYNGNPVQTNVYTMARGLIEDFTLPGALLVLFLAGIIAQILYERTKKNSVICMGLLSLFYSVLLWSITVNILNYNTIILCWLISFATLFFIKKSNFAAPQKTAD
ncbi:MAG TPA: O-antigen polymerase [Bacteroidales bacterium]|jgi:oligosaccharide repeat unit polymerase|nr:oligosaccharide repeat unit polymerase [Bacteroidales bacterium]HNZ43736.1 O-antigen polymerase [Bacteroidales bacterium]HOH84982.1 O-antigen polymerase [Bacteroidales bacterium]HPB24150.1 O-antigen polymerase [Bacteroidales bacterium]HPI29558.1 O-antigen polymerase [Bacteroidales bacterium]